MRMLAVINQKGGVGKTTTTLNLAHAVAQRGKRVLCIDLDPQAHLTAGFGQLRKAQHGVADLLLGEMAFTDVVVQARANLDLIPAGERLGELEHLNQGGAKRGWLLRDAISEYIDDYDFVFVDCPPSSGILGMNALLATREVLIPVSGDFFALQGLSRLMGIFQHIEGVLKTRTEKWVVLTRYQERRRLARDVRDKILGYFPKHVYRTPIRETVALAESPGFGKTIFEYQGKGNGAMDYMNLAEDVLLGKVMHA
ncbi:MAG: AAA family ATPase [Gammaproteobacteria bacterium]|nr:AAA family ATPase [Gammaproteobacteria bacterium]